MAVHRRQPVAHDQAGLLRPNAGEGAATVRLAVAAASAGGRGLGRPADDEAGGEHDVGVGWFVGAADESYEEFDGAFAHGADGLFDRGEHR